jgi:hypothetical protein
MHPCISMAYTIRYLIKCARMLTPHRSMYTHMHTHVQCFENLASRKINSYIVAYGINDRLATSVSRSIISTNVGPVFSAMIFGSLTFLPFITYIITLRPPVKDLYPTRARYLCVCSLHILYNMYANDICKYVCNSTYVHT